MHPVVSGSRRVHVRTIPGVAGDRALHYAFSTARRPASPFIWRKVDFVCGGVKTSPPYADFLDSDRALFLRQDTMRI